MQAAATATHSVTGLPTDRLDIVLQEFSYRIGICHITHVAHTDWM